MILSETRTLYVNTVRPANLIVAWKYREEAAPVPVLASGVFTGDSYTLVQDRPKTSTLELLPSLVHAYLTDDVKNAAGLGAGLAVHEALGQT